MAEQRQLAVDRHLSLASASADRAVPGADKTATPPGPSTPPADLPGWYERGVAAYTGLNRTDPDVSQAI